MGIDCRTSTGLRETETPHLEGTHKVVCASGRRGRSSDPRETEPDLPASVGGSPAEAVGGCGSPWGQGHWQQQFWEVLLGVSPPRVCHYHKQRAQVGSSVGLPQAKQPTGREPSPTHQQSSGLKFYWTLPTRATVSSTHHQSLPSRLLVRLIYQRADSSSKKKYNPVACGTKTTFTER